MTPKVVTIVRALFFAERGYSVIDGEQLVINKNPEWYIVARPFGSPRLSVPSELVRNAVTHGAVR